MDAWIDKYQKRRCMYALLENDGVTKKSGSVGRYADDVIVVI